jgi:putative lipase involved disintegration of autophagic bodies
MGHVTMYQSLRQIYEGIDAYCIYASIGGTGRSLKRSCEGRPVVVFLTPGRHFESEQDKLEDQRRSRTPSYHLDITSTFLTPEAMTKR